MLKKVITNVELSATTADHEAGHAVVAYVLGHPITGVSSVADTISAGRCAVSLAKVHPEFGALVAAGSDAAALEQIAAAFSCRRGSGASESPGA